MKHRIQNLKLIFMMLLSKLRYPNIEVKYGTYLLKNSIIDNTKIGKYTYIASWVAVTGSYIGNYCSIAPGAKIGLGEHGLSAFSTSRHINNNSNLLEKKCILEHDVWVGTGAVILRGVKISTGAVIGANAVVTKDVEPFAVVAGCPAKIIKYRFNPEKIQKLLESKWWELEPKNAKNILSNI